MEMLQVQKELIWKPEEFNEDTDGNCSLKGWTQTALFPLQPTHTNTDHSKPLGLATLPNHIPGIQPQLLQRTKPQEAPS